MSQENNNEQSKELTDEQKAKIETYRDVLQNGEFDEVVIEIGRLFKAKIDPELILGMLVATAAEKGGEFEEQTAILLDSFDERAAPVLYKILQAPEFSLRLKQRAAVNLGYSHDLRYQQALVEAFDKEGMTIPALEGLLELSPRYGVQLCLAIINENRVEFIDKALALLKWSHIDGNEVAFYELLSHEKPQARKLAIEKVRRLNYKAAIPQLAKMAAEDPQEDVRSEALESLKKWNNPDAQAAYKKLAG